MADLNKVFLIGRLTHDPELRYTPNGAPVTDLRIATSRQFTGKDGSPQKDTLYIDVTVWNRQAENCCQFLRKGRQIHVEGFLKMESWEDKQTGQQRSKVKVEGDRVQFLDGRRDEGGIGSGDEDYGGSAQPERRRAPETKAYPNGPSSRGGLDSSPPSRRTSPPPTPSDPDGDEDIPF
ncbi:MAG: single-stranded DNA-binding protein [Isosphaeraceae bacterium]